MSKWVGFGVSVNCGQPLGCYQGTICEADDATLTLTKAFRNGYPYPKSRVTLSVVDIKELKIIELGPEKSEHSRSTVAVRGKKSARHTVCETLQASRASVPPSHHSSTHAQEDPAPPAAPVAPPPRTKPIDIQQPRHSKNNAAASGGTGGGRARRKQDQWLATTDVNDPALLHDFDFQTNLALFRKLPAPDLLRAVPAPAPAPRHLYTASRAEATYATDDGALVPAVSRDLRRRLRAAVRRAGLSDATTLLLARAAADLALKMLGGARRLAAGPEPRVLATAGAAWPGAVAVHAARLLLAAGASVELALSEAPAGDDTEEEEAAGEREDLRRALAQYRLAGGRECSSTRAPDLVLVGVSEPVPGWCSRCQVLHVEGGGEGRAGLWALPVPRGGEGRMHAAHTALPAALLRPLGISEIRSAVSLLALHRVDDE